MRALLAVRSVDIVTAVVYTVLFHAAQGLKYLLTFADTDDLNAHYIVIQVKLVQVNKPVGTSSG